MEYLIYRPTVGRLESPEVEEFAAAYNALNRCSFPLVCNPLIEITEIDHSEAAAEYCVRRATNTNLAVKYLPKTLWELVFLRDYLYGRVRTAFANLDDYDREACLENGFIAGYLPCFLFDHNIGTMSVSCGLDFDTSFFSHALAICNNESLLVVRFELNRLLCDMLSYYAEITDDAILTIAARLVADIRVMEKGSGSDLSQRYALWPLTHPDIEAYLTGDDPHTDIQQRKAQLAQLYHEQICPQMASLRKPLKHLLRVIERLDTVMKTSTLELEEADDVFSTLHAQLCDAFSEAAKIFTEIYEHVRQSEQIATGEYALLVRCLFHPILDFYQKHICGVRFDTGADLSMYLSQIGPKRLRQVKRACEPMARVDPCVYCFRKPGFLSWNIISRALHAEIEAFRATNGDAFLLYRGTRDIASDGPVLSDSANVVYRPWGRDHQIVNNPARAHALSFGASLFAGMLHDTSAVAYCYMRKRGHVGYALQCSKREYIAGCRLGCMTDASVAARLFIPPLPLEAQLAALGELFHPRAKVCLQLLPTTSEVAEENVLEDPSSGVRLRALFVSGILSCSYAKLPAFLQTTPTCVASWKEFRDSCKVLISHTEGELQQVTRSS